MASKTKKKPRSKAQKQATAKLVARNKAKSRKSSTKKRKSTTSNKRKPTKKVMAKSRTRRDSRGLKNRVGSIFKRGFVGEAVAGIGAAAIVGTLMDRFLPQSPITNVAKPIAAYASGGVVGAISSIVLNGGLGQVTGFLGGTQPQQMEYGV